MIRRAFAFPHTGFSRLFGDRLIGKQSNPDLATTLDETSHGHATRLDLPVGNPSRLEDLPSVIPERQRAAGPGLPGHAPALLLAVLNFLLHQQKISSRSHLSAVC